MKKILLNTHSYFLKKLCLILWGVSLYGHSQVQESDSVEHFKKNSYLSDNKKTEDLDLLIDSLVKSFMQSPENCALSIGVIKNGKTYFYNYGEIRRNSGTLPDKNTIYEIGSLTASFCGILISQAIIEKKIKAEDDIRNYFPGRFPELQFNKTPVRIKHLLLHSSGLPQIPDDLTTRQGYDSLDPYKNYSREDILNFLKRVKLADPPGKVIDYSSLGIAVSGMILESVYKVSFDSLVKQKMAGPFAMTNTTKELTWLQMQNAAKGHNENGETINSWNMNAFEAAGGMKSSSGDLIEYLQKSINGTEESFKLAQQAEKESGKEKTSFSWLLKKTNQGNILNYQSGGTIGSAGFMGFLKKNKSGVVVLSNSGRNVDYIAIGILNYLQK